MSYTIRPVSDRTMFTGKHRRGQFATAWPKTERLLLAEIKHLGGRDIIIEVDVTEMDIRNDGRLRASARPATPGVRVAFMSKHGALTYATDQFTAWQDNVRAIALGLEALRAVDRYGITKNAEQYAGWKAIGSGIANPSGMTPDAAREILCDYSLLNMDVARTEPLDRLLKLARRNSHPDRNNGDRHKWNGVENAAKVLGLLA